MGVAKSDSLTCVWADHILIENAERFARIDLDLSDFEKERTHCEKLGKPGKVGATSYLSPQGVRLAFPVRVQFPTFSYLVDHSSLHLQGQ